MCRAGRPGASAWRLPHCSTEDLRRNVRPTSVKAELVLRPPPVPLVLHAILRQKPPRAARQRGEHPSCGRQREPPQWVQDSRRAINDSERKLLTLRARQADYQRQLGNLRTQPRAAEQQAARYPGSQRSASVSIAGSSGVIPPRGTQASLPRARASTRTRSQSSGSVGSKARSPARQSHASDTYEADAKVTIQTER